jgi:hypothetical protein
MIHHSNLAATDRFANEKYSFAKLVKCIANVRPVSKGVAREFKLVG